MRIRTQTASNGREYRLRCLTRGEIRGFRAKGINLDAMSAESLDAAMDEVLRPALDQDPGAFESLDDLPNSEVFELMIFAAGLRYAPEPELKNSEPSGPGNPEAAKPAA